jgi:hypothetical protein
MMLALLSCIPAGHAEIIGWHPILKGIYEGRGVDIGNQQELKPEVAILDTVPTQTDNGGTSVQMTYAQHQFDLAKSFSLNSSISVKSCVFTGKIGVNIIDNEKLSQNTLCFAYSWQRDFGTKVYRARGVTPDLVAWVKSQPTNLTGTALRKLVRDQYGTHFISGRQDVARVVVLYTFQYKSSSVAQSKSMEFSSKYRSGGTTVSFDGDVRQMLNQSESDLAMSYSLDSTDRKVTPPFAMNGSITNYQQFQDFVTKLDLY